MTTLNVSLEPHLVDSLTPLTDLLPEPTRQDVAAALSSPSHPHTIPYSVLLAVSQWARSPPGQAALKSHIPVLQVHDYSMISLLAGSVTSPERKPPPYDPPSAARDDDGLAAKERKAITALVNGLFSVVGSGFAAWLASAKAGWRDEWRALFAIFVGLVVAIAEGILFYLWQSRQDRKPQRRVRVDAARRKKSDDDTGPQPEVPETAVLQEKDSLRLRTAIKTDDGS